MWFFLYTGEGIFSAPQFVGFGDSPRYSYAHFVERFKHPSAQADPDGFCVSKRRFFCHRKWNPLPEFFCSQNPKCQFYSLQLLQQFRHSRDLREFPMAFVLFAPAVRQAVVNEIRDFVNDFPANLSRLAASRRIQGFLKQLTPKLLQAPAAHSCAKQGDIRWLYGYGSIPMNTIFRGMNIHKSQLF